MKPTVYFTILTIMVALFGLSPAYAAEVDIPNSFSAGSPAVAAEVNANFDAIKTAVDDNDGRVAALEAALTALQDQVSTYANQTAALQTENDTLSASLAALEGAVTAMEDADYASGLTNLDDRLANVEANSVLGLDGVLTFTTDLNGYPSALFAGVNVQIVNGSGYTDDPITGTGNLIVGYNELRVGDPGDVLVDNRTGSHNIVVGIGQNYTSFGGLVAGRYNSIRGEFSSVTGGYFNTASGRTSSISGGEYNNANGPGTSIAGGNGNTANNELSTISGGTQETDTRYGSFALEPLFTAMGW